MPWLIALAGLAAIAAWTKMHPKDQDKVIGVDNKS